MKINGERRQKRDIIKSRIEATEIREEMMEGCKTSMKN
jgi:hypothetical protein